MWAKKQSKTELFETTPVFQALTIMAVPTIISQLIVLIYNLADTWFIGQTDDPYMVAAAALVSTVFLMITGLSNLFGVGGGNLVVQLLGRRQEDEARRAASLSLVMAAGSALVFSLLCLAFMDPLLYLLGASENTIGYARQYLIPVVIIGALPTLLANTMSTMLRNVGYSKEAGFGVSLGGLLNVGLDPLFMFVFGLGTAGAGIATALSQSISFCILLSMFLRGKTVSQFRLSAVTREARDFGRILLGGAPSFGRQGLNSIGGMLLNLAARSYGDAAVAGMSIVSRIFMFIISVAIGVGQGLQPVASFNYGARKYRRVRQAAIFTIEAAFCMLVVLVGLCWVNGDVLIRLFRDDPAVTAVALPAFHYQCLAMLLHPIIVVANMTFQSVGASGRATFLACCRQGVFFIPLILILPRTHGLFGVEICQPIADVLTFLVSLPFLLAFLQQLGRMDDAEQSKTAS